ncbi:hypothetical protein ACFVY1_20360 [Streptomyces sp. NPDC058293]|uniref:hypothetical protein n=1 Tax=Streptomyces sp. NPDC058293 TaxID=3346429 RepID=UPI0036E883F7
MSNDYASLSAGVLSALLLLLALEAVTAANRRSEDIARVQALHWNHIVEGLTAFMTGTTLSSDRYRAMRKGVAMYEYRRSQVTERSRSLLLLWAMGVLVVGVDLFALIVWAVNPKEGGESPYLAMSVLVAIALGLATLYGAVRERIDNEKKLTAWERQHRLAEALGVIDVDEATHWLHRWERLRDEAASSVTVNPDHFPQMPSEPPRTLLDD